MTGYVVAGPPPTAPEGIDKSTGLRLRAPAAEFSFVFDIVVYRPENVALISGATRDGGVEIHSCSLILDPSYTVRRCFSESSIYKYFSRVG